MILASLRQGFLTTLAYKNAIFIKIIGEVILIFTLYSLWKAVGANPTADKDSMNLTSYIVIARIISNLTQTPAWGFFYDSVRKGTVIMDITKPISLIKAHFFRWLGQKFGQLILFSPIYIFIYLVFLLPNSFYISSERALAGLACVILAMLCIFMFEICFSTITFFTNSMQGVSEAKALFLVLASGSLFPLDILPSSVQRLLDLLPFKYMIYAPSKILTSGDWANFFYTSLYYQTIWIIIMYIAYSKLINWSLENYNSAGG